MSNYTSLTSIREFEVALAENKATLVYFSHKRCNVCHVLKPKVKLLIQNEFSKVRLFSVDTEENAEIAAQNRIFTVPTLIVYFEGKEFYKKSRNLGMDELRSALKRPYQLMFD